MHFRKITIIGVGLLGGSLGLAVKERRLARNVAGFVRRAAAAAESVKRGVVDEATRDLKAAVGGADLIVLCTPLAQMRTLVERMLPAIGRGAIVTDVGSVKAPVVRELGPILARAGARFVGSHPMAGSEKSGVGSARGDLFEDAVCVVTPGAGSDARTVKKVERFWVSVGARVVRLDPGTHDLLVSRSSHLPHIAAVTLANLVLHPANPKPQSVLCANGFRDSTRIASGSPEMWRDIALANRKHLGRALGLYIRDLEKFRRLLKRGDAKAIAQSLRQAKARRDGWSSRWASPSPE